MKILLMIKKIMINKIEVLEEILNKLEKEYKEKVEPDDIRGYSQAMRTIKRQIEEEKKFLDINK